LQAWRIPRRGRRRPPTRADSTPRYAKCAAGRHVALPPRADCRHHRRADSPADPRMAGDGAAAGSSVGRNRTIVRRGRKPTAASTENSGPGTPNPQAGTRNTEPREVFGWIVYDWANSAFQTTDVGLRPRRTIVRFRPT